MGTWGVGLFSDDLTADLRADFRDHIGDGLSSREATDALLREYHPGRDPIDIEPPFWLALAATQWSLGRLLPDVRDKALRIIADRSDLRRWDQSDRSKRQAILEKLNARLVSPPPAPKHIAKRRRAANNWRVGSVHAFRLDNDKLCLMRVTGHHEDKGGRFAVVELLDWVGETVPSKWKIWLLRPVKRSPIPNCFQFLLSEHKMPFDRFQDTGIVGRPSKFGRMWISVWPHLEEDLEMMLRL
jgi:hypothetical protein